jgi:hypothetical protein
MIERPHNRPDNVTFAWAAIRKLPVKEKPFSTRLATRGSIRPRRMGIESIHPGCSTCQVTVPASPLTASTENSFNCADRPTRVRPISKSATAAVNETSAKMRLLAANSE